MKMENKTIALEAYWIPLLCDAQSQFATEKVENSKVQKFTKILNNN